jgi:hypothetical protein
MKRPIAMDASRRGSRCVTIIAALALIMPVSAPPVFAQTPVAPGSVDAALSPEQLEKLVARIALYPDDLVALILPASTNPLQIVQADRFLAKRKADATTPINDKWDDSVKSLVNYPEVIASMSADLDWTAALGEAVVADQGEVLQAVQAFRRKAQAVGNLKSDSKQTVVVEKEIITIVPADPQVIYVPQYDPNAVVVSGYPYWGYYPYGYPSYYYPYAPGAALAAGLIWGAAIGAIWGGGHYVNHYGGGGNNNINIDRGNNINTGDRNRPSNQPAGGRGSGSSQWKPNKQPGQVSRTVGATPPARAGDRASGGAGGGGLSGRQGAARPSTGAVGGGGGIGSGSGPTASTRGGSGAGAFDGYGSGRQSQMNSSRGASSTRSSGGSSMSGRGGGGGGRGGGGRR